MSATPHQDAGTPAEPIRHDRITEVAAAVFLRPAAGMGAVGRTEYLLAQRPPGKAYAGYWEFPGGKREPGEALIDTCRRELQEELGVDCERILPWINREFVYPHAHVRLRFFRVTAWRGPLQPLEHTGIAWQQIGQPPTVTPLLPANGPIIKSLELPTRYAITCVEENGMDDELARAERAIAAGCRLFQVRDKTAPREVRQRLAEALIALARPVGGKVLINEDEALAREVGADGLHLTAAQLATFTERPDFPWVGASCHDAAELGRAAALGLDFAVLGPVFPTPTHPGQATLGWAKLEALLEHCTLPVFALGGVRPGMDDVAQQHGAHGVAVMRSWPE
jgi:8-oxo-dGTP diphosphatase